MTSWLAKTPFTSVPVRSRSGFRKLSKSARAALATRTVARSGGVGDDHKWLFPGPIHGRPVTASSLTRVVVDVRRV
ncbi:hypothetical protein ACW0JT_19350 [Arthrobacter sp. SA17]